MAISAQMSLWGLFRIYPQLFDDLVLPSGVTRSVLIENLLLEAESMEVLYGNPEFLQAAIGAWSRKRLPVWEHMLSTENYTYNPIANYDRTEEITEALNSTGSSSSESHGSNTGTSKSTAYNSNAFRDVGQTITSGDDASRGTSSGTTDRNATTRTYGNIGVTTTQQMIEEERRVAQYNTVDFIINDFLDKFTIGVY